MDELERARAYINGVLNNGAHGWRTENELIKGEVLDQILSLVEIRADDQSLPNYVTWDFADRKTVKKIHQDMLKAGFIRVIPKPKRK